MTDETLLQLCAISADDQHVTEEWLVDLRLVSYLVGKAHSCQSLVIQQAMTLLAATLGRLPQCNPTHLPFGYEGPIIKSDSWIERESLEQVGKQIVGLLHLGTTPDEIATFVCYAVEQSIHLGFMQSQDYDAWRPGMSSGSGWRSMVKATPYGIAKARQEAQANLGQNSAGQPPDDVAGGPKPDEQNDGDTGDHEGHSAAFGAASFRSAPTVDDGYRWARQTELVRATNQVLGEGTLNKGVLSRACKDNHVQTKGKPGRGSLVDVQSFLIWAARRFKIGKDEQTQVRNAIIGEITERNS